MKKLINYLNPIEHLGDKRYSIWFPLLTMLAVCVLSEIYAYGIARDPMVVGIYAIFLFVALILYFSFREGIVAGYIASGITILYYFYIIYTRHYHGQQEVAGVETTIILAISYFAIASIIGWLKQVIDSLIEKQTDEKRRLQAIIQQLPVGVFITNSKGVLEQTNKKLEEILGHDRAKRMQVGHNVIEVVKPGDTMNTNEWPIVEALTKKKSVKSKEYQINVNGKEKYVNVSASVVNNKDGKVIAAASIVTDITLHKELEARKDEFLNIASHELKTPLTSLNLYIELLNKKMQNSDDKSLIQIIKSVKYQTDRLGDLVSDLLDVSRLQTGKLLFSKEEFIIEDLIQEIIDALQPGMKQKIIFEKKKTNKVVADRFRIYQVLTNLITNAIKYSGEEKEIKIYSKPSGDMVEISVKDNGIGVSKDEHHKIFERLYQVRDDSHKIFAGFGMGLYISKQIIEGHKGKIWVESEPGKGSTFYFTIPLAGHTGKK
jgi:PAS domain S-box-containing protein